MPTTASDLADRVGLIVAALECERERDRMRQVREIIDDTRHPHLLAGLRWHPAIAFLRARNVITIIPGPCRKITRGPRWEERAAALRDAAPTPDPPATHPQSAVVGEGDSAQ